MQTKRILNSTLAIILALSLAGLASGQETSPDNPKGCPKSNDLNDCINVRVKSVLKAKTDQGNNTKQTETPSTSQNSTSLVDESSASDLIGVGLNLAGLKAASGSDNMADANSVSVTATAYSLYSALSGVDPLNPTFYNQHRDWRRLSVTLGYDDEKKMPNSDETQRVKIFGAKFLIINKRDPSRPAYKTLLQDVVDNYLKPATGSFGTIINKARALIFKNARVTTAIVADANNGFPAFIKKRSSDLDAGVAAAKRVADAAEAEATRLTASPPANAKQAADVMMRAITQAATAELPTADVSRVIRGYVTDVNEAAERIARTVNSNDNVANSVQRIAVAARDAANAAIADASLAQKRITSLTGRNVSGLFVFTDSGFLASDATPEEREYYADFAGEFFGLRFDVVKSTMGPEAFDALMSEVDLIVEKELASFADLKTRTLEVIDVIRTAPQFSIFALTKQRPEGVDEYMSEAILDWGFSNRWNLTANGAFEYMDSKVIGGDLRGGRAALQLKYQLNRHNFLDLFAGEKPIYFSFAFEGKWMNGMNSMIKGQGKIVIPIYRTGIDLPLSFTIANRTEFIDEKEVKGQFGFTFDISRLVNALRPQ